MEKAGPPTGKNLANIINNIMFNAVIRKKLVQELQKISLKSKNVIKKFGVKCFSQIPDPKI